jgi:nitrite reductase (NO-forming)
MRSRHPIRTTRAIATLVAAALIALTPEVHVTSATPPHEPHDALVYGMPNAEIFEDNYSGPPVTGEAVTMLPELAPLAPGNRTHHVRIDVLAQQIEVAPGVRYNAWTFGGTVPGPVIHVREGDRVVFTMKNRANEAVSVSHPMKDGSPFFDHMAEGHHATSEGVAIPMAHSIDFHAAMVAPDDKYRLIRPGQSIRFEWVANYPGVFT